MDNQLGKKGRVVFKEYNQHQMMLLPPSLEELIPKQHLVRLVNHIIDNVDIRILLKGFKGGGSSSYHPRMMLKVLIYGYCTQINSSRRIAKALMQDIHFMWLSGMQKPDFRTLNNFRSKYLKPVIEGVFIEVLGFLAEQGYVKLDNYFVDGTKIIADANKFSYIWAKNTHKYKELVKKKIKNLLDQIEEENNREQEKYGDKNLEEFGEDSQLTSEQINKKAEQINERLKELENSKELPGKQLRSMKAKKKRLENLGTKLKKYEDQEERLAGRNSCSKTDKDATFMQIKDKRVLPAYNIINGTENQFILNYTIEQTAGDASTFVRHMEELKRRIKKLPQRVCADGAFGSEENYHWLEQNKTGNYLKYTGIYYEKKRKYLEDKFHKDHFEYIGETDEYICPNKKRLKFKENKIRQNKNGYQSKLDVYQCEDCSNCPYSNECKKSMGNREFSFSKEYDRYKTQARDNLNSEIGVELKKRRGYDVETPFGDIKHNMGFSRFRLRGLDKVTIEWGLVSMCHNIRKAAILNIA